jgi:hypothetical protein
VPFWTIRKYGSNAALFLANLISTEEFFEKKYPRAIRDGWFYQSVEKTLSRTGLNKYHSKKAIDSLEDVLEYKVSGLPPKRWFKIKWDEMEKILKEEKAKKRCAAQKAYGQTT